MCGVKTIQTQPGTLSPKTIHDTHFFVALEIYLQQLLCIFFIYTYRAKYFYRPQRSCGQCYIFTPVCHSVHGGGSASVHAGIPTNPEQTPPGSRSPNQTSPPGADTPPLRADTPLEQTPPPGKQTPAYGIRAAGTHPTGMHSCHYLQLTQFLAYEVS